MKLAEAEHQAARAIRVFGFALVPQVGAILVSEHPTTYKAAAALVVSAVVAAAETAYRQLFPTVPISRYVTPEDVRVVESVIARGVDTVPDKPLPTAFVDVPARRDDHGNPIA